MENTIEYNKEQLNIGGVEGYSITQKITTPERIIDGNTIPRVYYSVTMFNTDGYHDEIVEEFINSKTID